MKVIGHNPLEEVWVERTLPPFSPPPGYLNSREKLQERSTARGRGGRREILGEYLNKAWTLGCSVAGRGGKEHPPKEDMNQMRNMSGLSELDREASGKRSFTCWEESATHKRRQAMHKKTKGMCLIP